MNETTIRTKKRKFQRFWEAAKKLLETWSKYLKLREECDNVVNVDADVYVDVDKRALNDEKFLALYCLRRQLCDFRILCNEHEIQPIDESWLFNNLQDHKQLADCQAKLRLTLGIETPVSLKDFI